jgi:hypothetical protein
MVHLRWNTSLSLRYFASLFFGSSFLFTCAVFLPHGYLLQKAFHTSKSWGDVLLWPFACCLLLALIEAGSLLFNAFVTLDPAHSSLRWVSPGDAAFRRRRRPAAWDKAGVAMLGLLLMTMEFFSSLSRLQ